MIICSLQKTSAYNTAFCRMMSVIHLGSVLTLTWVSDNGLSQPYLGILGIETQDFCCKEIYYKDICLLF